MGLMLMLHKVRTDLGWAIIKACSEITRRGIPIVQWVHALVSARTDFRTSRVVTLWIDRILTTRLRRLRDVWDVTGRDGCIKGIDPSLGHLRRIRCILWVRGGPC